MNFFPLDLWVDIVCVLHWRISSPSFIEKSQFIGSMNYIFKIVIFCQSRVIFEILKKKKAKLNLSDNFCRFKEYSMSLRLIQPLINEKIGKYPMFKIITITISLNSCNLSFRWFFRETWNIYLFFYKRWILFYIIHKFKTKNTEIILKIFCQFLNFCHWQH